MNTSKLVKAGIAFAVFAVIALLGLTVLRPFTTVDSGTVGIVKLFGSTEPQALQPGFHWVAPWKSVVPISTRLKGYTVRTESQSQDLQRVATEVTVQHSLNPDMVVGSYQNIGDLDKMDLTITGPSIQESLKAVTAHYVVANLVQDRDKVKSAIAAAITANINETLEKKGLAGAITIHNVAITDFDFSESFRQSIEQKVTADQQALQAETDKLRRQTEAEAKAVEVKRIADGVAYETTTLAKARALAIGRETEALGETADSVVQLRLINRWAEKGGKLPVYDGGSSLPFIENGELNPSQK